MMQPHFEGRGFQARTTCHVGAHIAAAGGALEEAITDHKGSNSVADTF